MSDKTTHFGFRNVPVGEKSQHVRQVFDSVADNYDLMNDMMSLGIHRLWKRYAINMATLKPGEHVLDLAGGTGDLTRLMAPIVGEHGHITLADINAAMLTNGRSRLLDKGISSNVDFAQVDAEQLPFPDNSFDLVTMAFGLRNVTNKQAALDSIYRVLKPGGRFLAVNVGSDNWNIGLSLRRAYTVRDFLIAQGVAPERITARGYGPNDPIASNATPEGQAMNRRVELRIIE